MKKYLLSIILIGTAGMIFGQLPKTDAYILQIFNNGKYVTVRNVSYLSGMNPDGYNNQPSFASPSEFYMTTNKWDEQFTDIMKLDLITNQYYRVTATDSISEYSPTPKAIDGYLSCIRVEKDGATQSLHLYPKDHSTSGTRKLKSLSNIGYHHWISETELALFLVTDPVSLVIADIENDTQKQIAKNIGRCIRQDNNGNVLYVHKVTADLWNFMSYDPELEESKVITQTLPGSEDFELLPDGTIIMGNGSSLYTFMINISDKWQEAADLYDYGIEGISRLAVSRNKLVLINKR